MKYMILFLLAILTLNASAQTVDSVAIKQVDSLLLVSRDLTEKGNFDQALEVNASAEKIALKKLGKESTSYGNCCFNHGRIDHRRGNYPDVEKWYLESKTILGKALGKDHPDYTSILNNLAILYRDIGAYAKAEPLILEEMSIAEKLYGKEHRNYLLVLSNLANLYFDVGDFEKAEPLHLEVKDKNEKHLGKDHPEYASSLNNLAILYKELGAFEKSEMLQVDALSIQEKTLGKENSNFGNYLSNLAILYYDMGQYEKSRTLYTELNTLYKKIYGQEHIKYAECLNNTGALYRKIGIYDEAEQLYKASKAIREKNLGKEHPIYTGSLINLANLYVVIGHFEKAEPLYLEAISIDAKILGKDHPYYASDITNLAALYKEIGNYEKAEMLFLEAKEIREAVFGKESLYYAESLDHLGILYRYVGKYEKAESYSIESKLILEKTLGKDHPEYAWSLNNLAALYFSTQQYEKSEPLFLESISIFEKIYGPHHSDYTVSLSNLAHVYTLMQRYENAESMLIRSSKIIEIVFGKEHQYFSDNLNLLANLYVLTNKIQQAEALLAEKITQDQKRLTKACMYLSEKELSQYIYSFQEDGSNYNAYLMSIYTKGFYFDESQLPGLIFDHSLFHKGFLLNKTGKLQSLAYATKESNELSKLLKSYHRQLAYEYVKPLEERRNVIELEEKANKVEKEIALKVVGYADALRNVHWQEVKSVLKKGDVAIEFIKFNFNFPQRTDSVMYAAVLINAVSDKPIYIPLFEEKQLNALLQINNSVQKINHNTNLYASRGANPVASKNYSDLHQLIWKPLEPYLKKIKRIYFSPAGLLHQINLHAIPIKNEKTFSDQYQLIKLNSTRQLVIPTQIKIVNNDAVLFGGIQFDHDSTLQNNEPSLASRSRGELSFSSIDTSLRGGSWNYLTGTEIEVNAIEKIMQSEGIQTQLKRGYTATEESFKNIGANTNPSPRILHIATHGYFFSDPKNKNISSSNTEPVFKISDHPMLRSGLILAGGNAAWKGQETLEGREDGILTAYEISQMNLSNTELVVLSACETGLGDIQGNEGVYGLQRAFKLQEQNISSCLCGKFQINKPLY